MLTVNSPLISISWWVRRLGAIERASRGGLMETGICQAATMAFGRPSSRSVTMITGILGDKRRWYKFSISNNHSSKMINHNKCKLIQGEIILAKVVVWD